jgi:leader peptidase (prepilin peptidase)/N-methyltransferase
MDVTPFWPTVIGVFVIGASVGSFLNVVIHRLPMRQSLSFPGSHCPRCGVPIRPYDNIPLVSWLSLFGLCRECGASIPARYFFVELLTGLVTLAVVATHGLTVAGGAYTVLAWGLIAVTFIDLEYQIIPDEVSLGGVALGLALSPWLPIGFDGALIGLATGGGAFFLLAALYPGGMGGGDIKLIAAIGAFLGWPGALLTILVASVGGSMVGGAAMAFAGKGRSSKIPFGPFLALGALVATLAGEPIIGWYVATFVL